MGKEQNFFVLPDARRPGGLVFMTENGEEFVTIKRDGALVFGPNYHPDAAAKIFWDAVSGFGKMSPDEAAILRARITEMEEELIHISNKLAAVREIVRT